MNKLENKAIEEGIKELSQNARINEEQLRHVFDFEKEDLNLIATVEGKNEIEKQFKATVCILTAYHYYYNSDKIKSQDLRKKLEWLGIKSLVNLSTNLANYKHFIITKRKPKFSYKITYPGIKIGLEIIKELSIGQRKPISQVKEGSIELFYFEPDKRYTSKRLLSKNILGNLKGELRIVDPYCGERALDILSNIKSRVVKFLTRVENLRERERNRFLRELQDFKSEHLKIEFRNYPNKDIHDRYIISSELLVILGHSIKDLGGKESFAIILNKSTNKNIVEALIENFNRRWKQSNIL